MAPVTVVLLIAAGAATLVVAHYVVALGLPRGSFSICEGFVAGHWPFVFLNGAILAMGRGSDWASPHQLGLDNLLVAVGIAAIGLFAFAVGSALPTLARTGVPNASMKARAGRPLAVAAVLVTCGATAILVGWLTAPNLVAVQRPGVFLVMAQVLVPGAVFAWVVFLDQRRRPTARAVALAMAGVGIAATIGTWSRRYLVVVAAAAFILLLSRRDTHLRRRTVAAALPLLIVLSIVGLVLRRLVAGYWEPWEIGLTASLRHYADVLWLETSGLSGLAAIVGDHGIWTGHGFSSMLTAFLFWLPRSLFPWKPRAFNLAPSIGVDNYSVAPSFYGELLFSGTLVAVVLGSLALGVILKLIDLWFAQRADVLHYRGLHLVLALDAIFLVRGAFHSMAYPMMVHALVPLILLALLGEVRRSGRPLQQRHSH